MDVHIPGPDRRTLAEETFMNKNSTCQPDFVRYTKSHDAERRSKSVPPPNKSLFSFLRRDFVVR